MAAANELTCFKAYDIRGQLGEQLNRDVAYRIGYAYAQHRDAKSVAVGGDIRLSSKVLKQALSKGLMDAGANVIDIGMVGTEEIYFAAFHLDVDGAIEVTASHNPMDYNGMKLVARDAVPISGDSGLHAIKDLAETLSSPYSGEAFSADNLPAPELDQSLAHNMVGSYSMQSSAESAQAFTVTSGEEKQSSSESHPEQRRGISADASTEVGMTSVTGSFSQQSILSPYVEHLLTFIDLQKLKPLKLVVNAGNGAAGHVIDAIEAQFKSLNVPVAFIKVHHEPDGSFPNGIPNPLLPENRAVTADAVIANQADMGIAWDGDFDRCFLFDENGRFIEGYYIVGLLAEAFLRKWPGEKIIHDPRLTWNTIDQVEEAGGIPVQSKTGHAFIKERMRKENVIYGGEMSAHHYFRDFAYCDSGMIPWLLVGELISVSGKPLSHLVNERMEKYPCSGEINYKVEDVPATLDRIVQFYTNPVIARSAATRQSSGKSNALMDSASSSAEKYQSDLSFENQNRHSSDMTEQSHSEPFGSAQDRLRQRISADTTASSVIPSEVEGSPLRPQQSYPIIDKTDGISLEFEDWRFNLRASNTEPLLRLNVESRQDALMVNSKVKEIEKLIKL